MVDLNAFDPSLPRTMRAFLEEGDAAFAAAKRYGGVRGMALLDGTEKK